MTCDICGKEGARVRHVTRSYGKGKDLLVIENVPVVSCPSCGADNTTKARFCTTCGQALQEASTRLEIPAPPQPTTPLPQEPKAGPKPAAPQPAEKHGPLGWLVSHILQSLVVAGLVAGAVAGANLIFDWVDFGGRNTPSLSNNRTMRGKPTSPANSPRLMSQGESSPPYEPSQPATASTSTPKAQRISFLPPPPVRGTLRDVAAGPPADLINGRGR